ncbi:glycerol-3-phosphate acyltransferase 3-like [Aplysia californica]|uniref:Glycerol-3-phosphate acyltransferase 3-like n=1 Tax=Aplysia californica TaxID=6500 RepID=A0ABM0JNY9_APLCA|nr:glycerol-3-phosphate acyltransferase 3-like [Aplysia californica]
MAQLLIAVLSIIFVPVVLLISAAVLLATFGQSFGLRRAYVGILLKVFEACKLKVPVTSPGTVEEEDSEEEEEEEGPVKEEKEYQIDELFSRKVDGHSPDENDEVRVIDKDFSLTAFKGLQKPEWEPFKKEFELSDIMYFSKCGVEAIIDDDVTKRFSAEELASWNLLTRTHKPHLFMSVRLTALWCIGCFVRYAVLLPFRLTIFFIGFTYMFFATAFIGFLKEGSIKRQLCYYANMVCFRILCRSFSAVITFHNRENMAKNGIVVANHTSIVDVFMLSHDNCYAMIGQAHNGFLGFLQRALSRATSHIWFERSETKDRSIVARRLRAHIENPSKMPILIFPEGTCINNTSVMMFKKGSFEVTETIYPVAIKYDPQFGDAFWNSSKESFTQHLLGIMSSWALVCDVWYLPPMTRLENEDAVAFANRVKSEIARQGGLVDLDWDGGLKRATVKDSMKEVPQEQYSKILKVD